MKLLAKTTLMYLTITLLVFGLGGVMTYQLVTERVGRDQALPED